METTIHRLEQRVGRLERTNRILVATLTLLVVAGALSAVRVTQTMELVQARKVQLVDDQGRDDAGDTRLGAAQFAHGGGGYALHGPKMKGAAVLYLAGEGSLSMYDPEGIRTARFPAQER
jgi:hypothetical protein